MDAWKLIARVSILLLLPALAESGKRYLIVSPAVYRTGNNVVLSATLFGLEQRAILVTNIKLNDELKLSKITIFQPEDSGKPKDIILKLPSDVKAGQYKLVVTGSGDVNFKKSRDITIERSSESLFIQTDKPAYKPGDKVRFRVIVVTPQLKPAAGKVDEIAILNPSGSRILQWKEKDLDEGFVSLDFSISKKPVLGNWKITAKYQGNKKEVIIKVDKYVLPKFEVTVEEPTYLHRSISKFSARICAKYTYGKKVEGKVTTRFCYKYGWRNSRQKQQCVVISKKISGCVDFDVSMIQTQKWKTALLVNASVTESSTGTTLNATKELQLTYSEFSLKFSGVSEFKPGFPFKGKVLITYPDGRPALNKEINLKATCCRTKTLINTRQTAVNGVIDFVLIPPLDAENIRLEASHVSETKLLSSWERITSVYHNAKSWYSPSKTYLVIEKPKESLRVGEPSMINVKFNPKSMSDNMLYFKLACRGNIEHSGSVVHQNTDMEIASAQIPLFVTQTMVPKCRMLVFFVRSDGEFVSDSIVLPVEAKFENEVMLSFSESEVKPASNVSITLQAAPGSRFALSAVDKSVHLLGQSNDLRPNSVMNVVEKLDVTDIRSLSTCVGTHPWYSFRFRPRGGSKYVDGTKAFSDAGLIYLSNLNIDTKPCRRYGIYAFSPGRRRRRRFIRPQARDRLFASRGRHLALEKSGQEVQEMMPDKEIKRKKTKPVVKEEKKDVIVRTDFPETWIWEETKVDSVTGKKTLEVKVPDTLTTWYANAFAMSSQRGVGVSTTASLLVFQPFFVSLTLPYSLVRGESVKVPVTVFNYLDKCLTIRLSVEASNDFVTDISSSKLCVCGSQSNSLRFKITPKKIGRIPITVKAISTNQNVCSKERKMADSVNAADAVRRMLLVEPEGVKKEYNHNSLICLAEGDNGKYKEYFQLTLPAQVVPGSVFAKLSLYGDLMGPSLTDLDKLLAMPYGCGEQNMLKFAPNIYILQYLTKTKQSSKEIEERAKTFMVAGYQRELTYKRSDGSYSAFGSRDREGSTWLTAFVLKSYAQARPYIFIDEKEITSSMSWLLSLQKIDGCFKEVGMVIHKSMKGGVTSGISMTAFVLSALIEAGLNIQSREAVDALSCIKKGLPQLTDSYSVSLIAYTMTVAQASQRAAVIDKLKKLAVNQGGMTHWESEQPGLRHPAPIDIETTAYALLAYMTVPQPDVASAAQIVRWLAKQRNSLGGFASTQDTCVALQALAFYGGHIYKGGINLLFKFHASQLDHEFRITDDNKLVLQQVEIPEVPTKVAVIAEGTGCALLQANVKYNIPDVSEEPKFFLSLLSEQVGPNCRHRIKICASYYGKGGSNMALIEVKMVSGFEPVNEHLDQILQSTSNNLLKDYEVEDGKLSLYFEKIESKTCLPVLVEQTVDVTERKKAHVVIYDYYSTGENAWSSYSIDACKEWN
ncbi:alpha-1-macroglobulin-like [Rhopilema esculentum]|uniref:alpha-1-macroglobulin-like n=1 Tax=Rhopilema esculentum TaxID=499914 RepID=UPI0031D4DE98